MKRAADKNADLLFEIGTEELPAAYLPGLIEQLRSEAEALFSAQHLSFGSIAVYGSPRRLVLHVRQLGSLQQKPGEEVRGPSRQAAFDAQGKPTPALQGFLRSQGGSLAQTKTVSTPKGDYVYLIKPATATPTAALLPGLLVQLIAKLRSPKSMRWDETGVRFARPIRWLLARCGKAAVKVVFGKLTSQPKTRIGRPQQLRWAPVSSIESYFATLKRAGIILDHQLRRSAIEQSVAKAAKAFQGSPASEMIAYGLLDEVTFLAEQPVVLIGEFEKKYLALPREVLLASMAKHQRVFAVEAGGKLLARCIAILDGPAGKPADVRKVLERILNARLADSLLFWEADKKRSIETMSGELSGVTFHEKLGSMADKAARLQALSVALKEPWQLRDDAEFVWLRKAALFAKADLVSTMVREFPTLQGVMGKYYARSAGLPVEVAEAIEEHYLPLANKQPKTLVGSALSILDKFDTLAGYFSVGIMPTGDQDPFGLRRAAQGIVEVAWAVHRPLPLPALFEAWQKLSKTAKQPALAQQIQTYLLERLYTFAWPAPAPSADCISAVVELYQSRSCGDLVDAMDRIRTLQQMANHPGLIKAAKVIERTRNILKGAKPVDGPVDPALLKEPPEQTLWSVYEKQTSRLTQMIDARQYDRATVEFGETFYEPLHVFFDNVMVNVPDAALCRNRLALMRAIHTLYTDRVADLSKLIVLQQHKELS